MVVVVVVVVFVFVVVVVVALWLSHTRSLSHTLTPAEKERRRRKKNTTLGGLGSTEKTRVLPCLTSPRFVSPLPFCQGCVYWRVTRRNPALRSPLLVVSFFQCSKGFVFALVDKNISWWLLPV